MGSRSKSNLYISRRNKKTISRRKNKNVGNTKLNQILERKNPVMTIGGYTGQKNVFISFSMRNKTQVHFLRAQAKDEKNELKFKDYSAKEKFDSKWKTQMENKMKLCSTTVCMIGEDTHRREAVKWELKKAHELGHKVIGVIIYRDENHRIPEPLVKNKSTIITWTLGDLMEQLNTQ